MLTSIRKFIKLGSLIKSMETETVTLPRAKYDQMVVELETLRQSDLYKRLLQFTENIQKARFTRKDVGF